MILKQRATGKSWEIRNGLRLGRLPANDVVLHDNSVSRNHAEVESRNGVFWLQDLNSSNGLQRNGRIEQSFPLRAGDLITVGQVAFDVEGAIDDPVGGPQAGRVLSDKLDVSSLSEEERARIRSELQKRRRSRGFGDLSQQPFLVRGIVYLGALGLLAAVSFFVRWLSGSI